MGLFGRDTSRDPALTHAFAQYAVSRGFSHRGLFPEVLIEGQAGGVRFRFHQYEHEREETDADGDRHHRRWWAAEAYVHEPEWLGDLLVDEEHAVHRFVKFFGGQDITTGVPEFDAAFVVKCGDEARARRLLTPAACRAFLDVRREKHPVTVINGRVEYAYGGIVEDPREADTMLRATLHVAGSLGR